MLRPLDLIQVIKLCYLSSTMTSLNRVSPFSVLFKDVLWIKSVVLNQIEWLFIFVMMTVSTNEYVLYTLYEMAISNIYHSFP